MLRLPSPAIFCLPAPKPACLALMLSLAVLAGCDEAPVVASSGYYASAPLYQVVLDPAGENEAFETLYEAELARGAVTKEVWVWLLRQSVTTGAKDVFTRLAESAARVRASLREERAGLLATAAGNGRLDMLSWLLYDPAWQHIGFDINEAAPDLGTPINQAIARIDFRALDWLLEQGADPERRDNLGQNALNAAVAANTRSLFKRLLARGMSLNPEQARPPLLNAVALGNKDWIEYLLAEGADINLAWRNLEFGGMPQAETVLKAALENGAMPEILELLFDKGFKLEGEAAAEDLLTYFATRYVDEPPKERYAYHYPEREALELLLRRSPGLKLSDSGGRTLLMVMAEKGHFNALKRLIAAGADPKASDKHGKTLLMFAASSGSLAMVQYLIDLGADPDQQDFLGKRAQDYVSSEAIMLRNYLLSIPRR